MKNSAEVLWEWLEAIKTEGRGLTKWEQDFVDSIWEQFEERGSLSDRQEEILERIYSEKTP